MSAVERAKQHRLNQGWNNYGRTTAGSWYAYRRLKVAPGLYSVQAHYDDGASGFWIHVHWERCEIEKEEVISND